MLLLSLLALAFSPLASAGTLTCPVSSNLTISTTVNNVASSCIVDFGVTLTIADTGDLANVGPSGSGILENNGTLANYGAFTNDLLQTFTNFGTVFNNNYMDMGGGTFTNASIFDNFGTVTDTFSDGTLNNTATFTNDGSMTLFDTFNNFAGAHFNNVGFLYLGSSLAQPLQATNNGTLTNFTGGDLEIVTPFTNNGSLVNAGTLGNGNAAGTAPPTFINNGTITNNGSFTNGAAVSKGFGSLVASFSNNGTFDNVDTLTSYSEFDNNAGASVINEKGATFTIDDSFGGSFLNAGSLTNNGSLIVGNGRLLDQSWVVNNGSITNSDGFVGVGVLATLTNAASSTFLQTGGQTKVDGTLNNSVGSTFLQTGGDTMINGILNSVPAVQIQGGTLSGFGQINGNVSNTGGIVEPGSLGIGGALNINGDYTQGSGGTLTIDFDGSAPGDFSVLDVTGLAALDGTVDFEALNGFTPVAGDDFTFLLFGSLSGDFTTIDFTNWTCPTGDSCTEVLGANNLSLDITGPQTTPTPEPASLLLLGTGILLIGRCSRRKKSPEIG